MAHIISGDIKADLNPINAIFNSYTSKQPFYADRLDFNLNNVYIYIVTYFLKARTVEPEKQLLLANVSETAFVSRQRLRKHVSAATDTHAKRRTVGNGVFCSVRAQMLTGLELSQ
jgi:hypothetical protein